MLLFFGATASAQQCMASAGPVSVNCCDPSTDICVPPSDYLYGSWAGDLCFPHNSSQYEPYNCVGGGYALLGLKTESDAVNWRLGYEAAGLPTACSPIAIAPISSWPGNPTPGHDVYRTYKIDAYLPSTANPPTGPASCATPSLFTQNVGISKYVDPMPCKEGYLASYSTLDNAPTCKKILRPEAETEQTSCRADGIAVGAPIVPATGDKIRNEVDYVDGGAAPLSFERFYSSIWGMSQRPELPLGRAWGHNHQALLENDNGKMVVSTGQGTRRVFAKDPATLAWYAPHSADTLTAAGSGWVYHRSDDDANLSFGSNGKLLAIVARNGWTTTYGYDGAGQLTSVSNGFGRTLSLGYNAQGQLTTVTAPDGRLLQYAYDPQGRLKVITYPDGQSRKFLFENSTWPNALNGILDENGLRYATFRFRAEDGRAVSTELADWNHRFKVAYPSKGVAVITDPLDNDRTYKYTTQAGKLTVSGSSAPSATGERDAAMRTQDANGLVVSETDFKGVVTSTIWDVVRRLPLVVTRSVGNPDEVTVTTQWHPVFRLPVSVVESGRTTNFTYDTSGNLVSRSIVDMGSSGKGVTRTWSATYDSRGLLATETSPNGATSVYQYDASGNLTQETNALGHATTYGYDSANRLSTLTQPNGLVTAFTYDARDRLTSRTVGGQQTTLLTYNKTGTLSTLSLPNGLSIAYKYDNSHQLTGWSNNRGESGTFVLDRFGNRQQESVKNSGGALAFSLARTINETLNRVLYVQPVSTERIIYGYDANGELVKQTDKLNQSTQFARDGLRRIKSVTNALNVTATLERNALGNVTQASDFGGVITNFGRDALGNAIGEWSADIGARAAEYDALGLATKTYDGLGKATNIERDALGRPTAVLFPDGKTTTFRYDHGGNDVGYLSEIHDRSGVTEYTRDGFARVIQKKQTLANGSSQTVTYGYAVSGALSSIGYPSGDSVGYQYDSTERLSGVSLNGAPLITGIVWNALGQPMSWTWAFTTPVNSSRSYDLAGRMKGSELGLYGYDAAGRVNYTSFFTLLQPGDADPKNGTVVGVHTSTSLGFSADRVANVSELGVSESFSYDANGNRAAFARTRNGITTTRSYAMVPASNRAAGFTQTINNASTASVAFSYNANGDLVSDGLRSYTYDAEGRLASATTGATDASPTTRYAHNALGQRVFKTEPLYPTLEGDAADSGVMQGLVAFFAKLWNPVGSQAEQLGFAYVYDEDGSLIAELGSGGAVSAGQAKYIYLPTMEGPMPITAIIDDAVYAVHTDHLNTPRQLTNDSGQVVWQWPYSAFGELQPRQAWTRFADLSVTPNPGHTDLREVRFNLRYPGQYADDESGLFYNNARSYDPREARYSQADPIGLRGGWNRFEYARGNPFRFVDPSGLDVWGGDPSLKRIDPTDSGVKRWLCQANAGVNEYQTPGQWLALKRRGGLDKYDDNLAAAERFAMASEGVWDVIPGTQGDVLAGKMLVQGARLNIPGSQALLGNAGSSSPSFTEKWGSLGDLYFRQGMPPARACSGACK